MPKLTIPCEDCEKTKADLDLTGYRVISCEPKSTDPDMCVITFERAVAAAETSALPAGTKAKKSRKAAGMKPTGSRKKRPPARMPSTKGRKSRDSGFR